MVYVAVIWLAHPVLGMAAAAAAVLMLGLAVLNDFTHPARHRGAAEGRGRRDALSRSLAAERRGRADAGHDRRAARRAGAQQERRGHRAAAAHVRARRWRWPPLTRTVRQAVQVVMLALGAWLVIRGEATPGMMIATTILLGRALAPVEQVVGSWRVLAEGRAALPPPRRAARRGRCRARAHGAAGAARPAAARRAWSSARRRASA